MKLRITAAAVAGAAVLTLALCAYYRPTIERVRPGRRHVRVAAAADLRFALNEVVRRFDAAHDVEVLASYGSSGTFHAQLLNQAPFDMFLSADVEYPRQLSARGLTLPGSEFTYGVGRLVLWVRAASAVDVAGRGLATVADPSVTHVAIANPERNAGVYDAARAKLVYGENVEQALQYAQSGAADAAIVALSLALAPPVRSLGRYVDVPLAAYPRIVQGGVILRWAADVEAARALRTFLVGADGRAVLEQYGFFMPEE